MRGLPPAGMHMLMYCALSDTGTLTQNDALSTVYDDSFTGDVSSRVSDDEEEAEEAEEKGRDRDTSECSIS